MEIMSGCINDDTRGSNGLNRNMESFFLKEISLFQIFPLLIYEIPPPVQEKRGS